MKIHFYLINNNKKDEKPIYIFLRRNGKTAVMPTKLYLKPIYWDVKKQRAKAQYPLSLNFNKALDTIHSTLTDTYLKLIANNPLVSDELLFEKMKASLKPKSVNFWDAFDEFLKVKQNTSSRKYFEKFTTLRSKLKKFEDENHYVVSFDSINPLFRDKFLGYLIKRKNTNNTIATEMKNLKIFLKWAIEREFCEPKDYSFLRHRKEEADTFALTKDELRKIYNLDLSNRTELAKSRDAFLVACLTALRFEDVRNLDIRNILGNEVSSEVSTKDRKQLRVRQHKTKNFAEIIQNPEIIKILSKYNEPQPFKDLTNSKVNQDLKAIAKECGIDEEHTMTRVMGSEIIEIRKPKYEFISFHIARRTFATLSAEAGINPEYIRKVTGHRTSTEFEKYIRLHSRKIAEEFKKFSLLN